MQDVMLWSDTAQELAFTLPWEDTEEESLRKQNA